MLEMERVLQGQQKEWVRGKIYTFRCPMCAKSFTYDEPGEPICTGPNESTDEHPPETMILEKVVNLKRVEKTVDPAIAAARAAGPLWVP